MKNMKRIHKVVIKRMVDESPDTSWLGEYGQRAESNYSIDRTHAVDCQSQTYNKLEYYLNKLERAISYLSGQTYVSTLPEDLAESIQDAQNLLIEAQDRLQECTCGGEGLERNQYQFFNPNHENYKGELPSDIVKYCLQDYARMESLNAGDFCFIGIRADAEISLPTGAATMQTITSGSVWGIESDSGDYLTDTENEQLAELKAELKAIGFSSRAISAAFKTIERKED